MKPSPPVGPRHPGDSCHGSSRATALLVPAGPGKAGQGPGRGLAAAVPPAESAQAPAPGPRSCAARRVFISDACCEEAEGGHLLFIRADWSSGRCAPGCRLAKSCLPFEIKCFSKKLRVWIVPAHISSVLGKENFQIELWFLVLCSSREGPPSRGAGLTPQYRTVSKVCSVRHIPSFVPD